MGIARAEDSKLAPIGNQIQILNVTATETSPLPGVLEPPRRWSFDELHDSIEETTQPHELWDGELIMSPAPSFFHQLLVGRLYRAVAQWVEPRKLGQVVMAPLDMVLTQHHVTQPDVLFIANERRAIIRDHVQGAADIVAEVMSPGSRRRDRIDKRDLYEQHGVREYWIVDPDAQTVEVFFLEGAQYALVGRWRPGESATSRLLPGMTVSVQWLFTGEEH